ncbi:MAG: hypothetical protein RMY16_11190 [Nostoc sp. DedQUE12b]|nr:hypothetical protein [Nostoc sp. DedQUE12b]MDZ8086109.1 hypothetical protein [Nostoc sp. DedQUE12b]
MYQVTNLSQSPTIFPFRIDVVRDFRFLTAMPKAIAAIIFKCTVT